jgi:hypothetical protein
MMATLHLTVTDKNGGPSLLDEMFHITRETAREFINKMSAMVADLPGDHTLIQTIGQDGTTVVEIEFNRRRPPPPAHPTFEERFRAASAGNSAERK